MIAVLLATWNGEAYLEEQLKSLMGQTMQDFCVYAHDDGSHDGTTKILEDCAQSFPEKFFIVDGAPSGSAKGNFLYLMQKVSADYYMFCDQDDIWHPDKVEKTWRRMREIENIQEKPVLVHSDLVVVDASCKIIAQRMSKYQKLHHRQENFSHLLIQNTVTGCTAMINDSLKRLALRFHRSDNIIMHDWWLALVAARFGTIGYIDEALISYRQHGNNCEGAKPYWNVNYIAKKASASDEIRKSLQSTRLQAELFSETFETESRSLCSQYAAVDRYGKAKRLIFYFKNGVTKQGFIRNVGLFLFG